MGNDMNQADTLEKMMRRPAPAKQGVEVMAGLPPAAAPPRVICISSGKGGVGKTNLATNLAFALSKEGKKVLLLDADLNLANVDVLLGLTPKYNLHHVFLGERTLPEVLLAGPGGLSILPGSSGIMELAELTENQKMYFLAEMEELGQKIDLLLIDTAAGINKNVVYFNLAAQERVIILTPEPTSLTDAYALIKVLSSRYDVKKFRILVNMAFSKQEAVAVFRKLNLVADRFLTTLSLDFLGFIPYDENLPKAVRAQTLVSDLYPTSAASLMFGQIAKQLAAEHPDPQSDGNIKFFWQRVFGQ